MRLWIAEKPSVGKDIAAALGESVRGDGFITVGSDVISWCIGHLLEQAPPEAYDPAYSEWALDYLPIVPERWRMNPCGATKSQLNTLGMLLKQADSVVHCGDAAREGQMIVDEVLEHFRYKGDVHRLWLREMNTPAIRAAIKAITPNSRHQALYQSALARSRADWIMGMNLTRGFTHAWKSRGNAGPLHIGRVQTPTLCMIVRRDLDIESFVPVDYFVLDVVFQHANGRFTATWAPPPDADYIDASGHVLNRKIVQAVAGAVHGKRGQISVFKTTTKSINPPLPFSLGELQKLANTLFGLSPKQTLSIAQALYETHKLTSYPRTDYCHLPEDEHRFAPDIIAAVKSNFGDKWDFPGTPDFSLKSPAWNTSKIGDHHGIRPTNTKGRNLNALTSTELAVYRLIVRQFLAQFYPPYSYASMAATVECENHSFAANGQKMLTLGWRELIPTDKPDVPLPSMSVGDAVATVEPILRAEQTTPPPRFNGASLIDAMEKAHLFVTDPAVKSRLKETGIGTPATRAQIVESLVGRGYVTEAVKSKKKFYLSTPKGRALYTAVPDSLRKPDLTAYFEEMLKAVERAELPVATFMTHQSKFVHKLIDDVRNGSIAAGMPAGLVLEQPAPAPRRQTARRTSASPRRPRN